MHMCSSSRILPRCLVSLRLVLNTHTTHFRCWVMAVITSHSITVFIVRISWWPHQMETFPASLAIYGGNSPFTGEFPSQRSVRGALMFSLISVWINAWVNNLEAGDLRRHPAHYDAIVMFLHDAGIRFATLQHLSIGLNMPLLSHGTLTWISYRTKRGSIFLSLPNDTS